MSADDEFNRMMSEEFRDAPQPEHLDLTPYGPTSAAVKPGLTKRGKVALSVGAAVIVGSGLIGYQAYSADAAESEAKAQEIALKAQALELEKLKEINRANAVNHTAQVTADKARQTSVNSCVKDREEQAGKARGYVSYRDIVDTCQAQYGAASGGDGMQAASSSQQASEPTGGGVNSGVLLGGGALAVILVAAVKKGTRSNPS